MIYKILNATWVQRIQLSKQVHDKNVVYFNLRTVTPENKLELYLNKKINN